MYRNDAPAAYWRDQMIEWGPRVIFAILILVVTHFVAKAVQWGIAKAVDRVPVLKRHPHAGGQSVGVELAASLLDGWAVGMIAALQTLGLSAPDAGDQLRTKECSRPPPCSAGMFSRRLILAIVRQSSCCLGARNRAARQGRHQHREPPLAVDASGVAPKGRAGAQSIARQSGSIVSATIIIFADIAPAIMQISAISDPATAMLNSIAMRSRACLPPSLDGDAFLIGDGSNLVETGSRDSDRRQRAGVGIRP